MLARFSFVEGYIELECSTPIKSCLLDRRAVYNRRQLTKESLLCYNIQQSLLLFIAVGGWLSSDTIKCSASSATNDAIDIYAIASAPPLSWRETNKSGNAPLQKRAKGRPPENSETMRHFPHRPHHLPRNHILYMARTEVVNLSTAFKKPL